MASVSPSARLLSVATYDAEHGVIVLSEHPPFDEAKRFDPDAVRAYRASLADPARPGFGLRVDASGAWRVSLVGDILPESILEAAGLRVTVRTLAPAGLRAVLQVWRFEATAPRAVRWAWDDAAHVHRAAYAQLTEGGPLPPVGALARPWSVAGLEGREGSVSLARGGSAELRVAVGLGEGAADDAVRALDAPVDPPPVPGADFRARRAFAYAQLCALRVGDDAACIVADHQILPLSWNRDAYWVATLLRERGERELVRAHLRWLFRVAERRGGLWGRSHLANGRVKDAAFQLDQQCYPLLEAAEAGEAATYAAEIGETLGALERLRAGELYPTRETPADDPAELQYHFSSHVVLWRTLAALRTAGFAVDPERVRATALRAFVDGGRFAYATDGRGGFRHYHDANDLPTALAPAWGFCAADDPRWRATVAFAWSAENAGYFPGPLGGLGSLHTPHPWPLGDAQELAVARATGDAAREARVRAKLARVAMWDGLFPEAYDEHTGHVRSRHWFAWPAAFLALADFRRPR